MGKVDENWEDGWWENNRENIIYFISQDYELFQITIIRLKKF
jgi:hypothetical protein